MRSFVTSTLALALAIGLVGVATAAPKADSPNAEILSVECEGIGSFDVITKKGPVAFDFDGNVYVAKRFEERVSGTATTADGAVFPFDNSSVSGSKGKGFEDELVPCHFGESFGPDTFILDAESAEFYGVPESYIGTEVTVEGDFSGTAFALTPGR